MGERLESVKWSKIGLARLAIFALGAALVCVAACEKDATAPESAPGETAEALAPSQGAPGDDIDLNAGRYEVGGPATPVSVGESSDVTLSIKAADGLEINHEFPWSIEFSDADQVKLEQTSFAGDALKLGERDAQIPVKLAVDAPGEHVLEAVGNFSVCNDTQCYVIRDQKLAFHIEAVDADAPTAQ